MKTFEGKESFEKTSAEDENRKLVLLMYLLRAVSVTLMVLLLYYIAESLLTVFYPTPTFPEFVLANYALAVVLFIIVLLGQLLVYLYRLKTKARIRRSTREMIVGYALPIIGIIATVYTAYAIGAM